MPIAARSSRLGAHALAAAMLPTGLAVTATVRYRWADAAGAGRLAPCRAAPAGLHWER